MISILGRIFKTLSYHVNKDINETLYANEVFISRRWGLLERNVLTWSIHYKKYILLSLALAILIALNLVFWQPWLKHIVFQHVPRWKSLLEWQGGFLSGQLTIVGVVYPLVVGLVSVLFQNKSAKKVILPIYQKYSGFMFSGLSGLALSGFIVIGYFSRAVLEDHVYAAICLTSAMWLFANILLTAWFFTKTFRMLDERSRDDIVFRFYINEICENDTRKKIKAVLVENAVDYKLIASSNEEVMTVLTRNHYNENFQELTYKNGRLKVVEDVRFWLINIAIKLQIFILKNKNIKGCKLVIKPELSQSGNFVTLARYHGFDINPIVKILIQKSFRFKKEGDSKGFGLSTVLVSFVGSANDALRDKDPQEFSIAVEKLAEWHAEVAQALSFINDKGNMDNWLLLPAGGGWGRSYLDELLREYYRLARDSVERMPDSSSFYKDMLYLPKRIFIRRNTALKEEMRSLIQCNYFMWHLLIEWRSYNSESSDLRIANKYEDILYDFVGAWELWLTYIQPRSKRMADIDRAYPAFISHLEFTASTAISALRFNNFEAAGWGVDMLNNWFKNFSYHDHWNEEYSWRAELINHSFLSVKEEDPIWQIILQGGDFSSDVAFNLAFKNAHLDLRIITACYMLLKPGDLHRDLLITYVNSLLSGERIHPGGSTDRSRNRIENAGDLLGAYIRHRDYFHFDGAGYGSWLSSILESFGSIYEERRVSGRIYSGWGATSPRSMSRAYVEIGISMSKRRWSLSQKWVDTILSDAFKYSEKESIVGGLREWVKIAQDENSFILIDSEHLAELKDNFIESVEGIIQKLSDAQSKTILEAKIDQERLRVLGIAGSRIFRSDTRPEYPISLFERLERVAHLDESWSFQIEVINYSKEDIALGVETNRAGNEEECLVDCISENVKENLMRYLLTYPRSQKYKFSNIKNILSKILDISETMACPVLFVGNQTISRALYQYSHEREFIDSYRILRQDGHGDHYECHIGRCEVYMIPFGTFNKCILTSKEIFETIKIRRISEEQYVDVGFELNEGSETQGKLKLKYWMKVGFGEGTPCIELDLNVKDEPI